MSFESAITPMHWLNLLAVVDLILIVAFLLAVKFRKPAPGLMNQAAKPQNPAYDFQVFFLMVLMCLFTGLVSDRLDLYGTGGMLRTDGIHGEGRIDDLVVQNGKSPSYYVSYRFTPESSISPKQRYVMDSISADVYQRLRVGQMVPVLYSRSMPEVSCFELDCPYLESAVSWDILRLYLIFLVGVAVISLVFVILGKRMFAQ